MDKEVPPVPQGPQVPPVPEVPRVPQPLQVLQLLKAFLDSASLQATQTWTWTVLLSASAWFLV